MKLKSILVTIICFFVIFQNAQNFTWIKGGNFSGVITGTYGTQGVASTTNHPGSRHGCATWVDNSGNLWLFGGEGTSGTATLSWLNDLWKYNPTTNQWTWVRGSNAPNQIGTYGTQGVASPSNEPGAREFTMFWTDASGNFWLFGGDGYASNTTFGRLGDLWRYNPSTNQWTWMKGFNTVTQNGVYGSIGVSNAANLPGSRLGGAAWLDASGTLWLFGGKGYGASGGDGLLSDLWKYNPSNNQWTWVHGPNSNGQFSTYGTINTPSVANNPGGREQPAPWIDAAGNFYLFGGRGFSNGPGQAYLNDMWKYNPTNDTWAWINGSNTNNPTGTYGTLAVPSVTNNPGGRFSSGIWTDATGNFWLFGGLGWSSISSLANLNDLWKYNPTTNQWAWMKGANAATNVAGVYGTMGIANQNNMPGGRHYNSTWRNLTNYFWLFGGEGIDNNANNPVENMNDLWGFAPPCNPDSINTSFFNLCSGGNAILTANNQFPANVVWYNSPASTNSIGVGNTFNTGSLTAINSSSVYAYYAQSNNCTVTPRAMVQVTVNPIPNVAIVGTNTICAGTNSTLTATGANSYSWANGVNNNSIVVSPTNNFTYTVIGSALACTNSAASAITVQALPTLTAIATRTLMCRNESNTLSVSGAITYTWSNQVNTNSFVITPSLVTTFVYTVSGTDQFGCQNNATVSVKVNPCLYSVNEYNKIQSQLYIYPNPSNGNFTYKNESSLENLSLEIYNGLGQLVFVTELNKNEIEIKSRLANSVYYYAIKQNTEALKTGKLIVE
jgi:N-acetylneuraminic acid mutarotase